MSWNETVDFLIDWGDVREKPNPCLGAINEPPFFAVALYPGDVGTYGGLVTDEFGRALNISGTPIENLYATGNSTASVTGDCYPGAGASIGASFIFGYRAARHARRSKSSSSDAGRRARSSTPRGIDDADQVSARSING